MNEWTGVAALAIVCLTLLGIVSLITGTPIIR